jgi:2-isopropylmalate synthase
LVTFIKNYLKEIGHPEIVIEWHGHRDMGNDLENAMMAISAGATRIHTVPRGIGERAGNTQLEAVLLNAKAILEENNQQGPWHMEKITQVLDTYNQIVRVPVPKHGPLSENSFSTTLGIHTDAMSKADRLADEADKLGEHDVAKRLRRIRETVYSAVDPGAVGRQNEVGVGPLSGSSTVRYYVSLNHPDYDMSKLTEETVRKILLTAKNLGRKLTPYEFEDILKKGD